MPRRLRIGFDAVTSYQLVCLPGTFTSTGQDANLVYSAGTAPSLTLNSPSGGLVGSAVTGSVHAAGAEQSWTISVSPSVAVTPSSGTTPAGTSTSYSFTPSVAGDYVVTLTNTGGGSVIGSPDSVTVVAPGAPPTSKYRFQQPLLTQRAHQKYIDLTYTNHLGQEVTVPSARLSLAGYSATGLFNRNFRSGPDDSVLCTLSMWKWKNPGKTGGDWIDANLSAQGSVPWASTTIASGTPAGEVTLDVSSAIARCDTTKRWYAFILRVTGSGTINLVGPCNQVSTKSVIECTRGGSPETWDLWTCATLRPYVGASATDGMDDFVTVNSAINCLIEFFRPDETAQGTAASVSTLRLRHNGVSGGAATVQLFIVDPFVPDIATPAAGLAAAYPLDEGIWDHPDVAVSIAVRDTTTISQVMDEAWVGTSDRPWLPGVTPPTMRQEVNFDPSFWGTPGVGHMAAVPTPTPTQLDALLPRRAMSSVGTKLVGFAWKSTEWGDTFRVMSGADLAAEGLPVLAPGLGAMRFRYHSGGVENGQSTYPGDTTGGALRGGLRDSDLYAWFKPEHMGKIVDGYMRMNVMLGPQFGPNDARMKFYAITSSSFSPPRLGLYPEQYGANPQTALWRAADQSMKCPGGIQHVTNGYTPFASYLYPTRLDGGGNVNTTGTVSYATTGYSASSGVYAYQGRWMLIQGLFKEGLPGPCVGGAKIGMEFYDFTGASNHVIPSQAYIGGWDGQWMSFATHYGGLGFLYPQKWYCVEMRWKMNTITFPYAEPAPGTHYLEGGFQVDGFLEWWIDGIYAAKTPLFAHRSSRMLDWALQIAQGKPWGTAGMQRIVTNVPQDVYMGATHAICQVYYGGQSLNPHDLDFYANNIVVTNGQYIGPVAGVSRANGGLGT